MKKNFIKLSLFFAATFAFIGCSDNNEPVEKYEDMPYLDKICEYYKKDMPELVDLDKGYSAYFDISDGMEYAYKSDTTRGVLNGIVQYITGNYSDWTVFALDKETVCPLQQLSQTELFNKITLTQNNGIMAPIEKALDSIVNGNKRSILVTDFEEYKYDQGFGKNVIEKQCYAKSYFEKWLSMGGMIKFYITEYNEHDLNKKLFFVIFDGADRELIKKIDDQMKGRDKNYDTYVLSNTLCEATPQYGNKDVNISERINGCEDDKKYTSYGKMEYYPLKPTLVRLPADCNSDRNVQKDKYIGMLSDLYVNLAERDAYIIKTLKLNVYDVTEDFNEYGEFIKAKLNEPKIETTPEGVKKVKGSTKFYSVDSNNWVVKLKEEYDYNLNKDKYKPEVLKGIFKINDNLFVETNSKDPQNTHIAIDLDSIYIKDENVKFLTKELASLTKNENNEYRLLDDNAKGAIKRLKEIKGNILRIDICLGESEFDNDRIEDLFLFESNLYQKDNEGIRQVKKDNDCIYESIRQILQSDKLKPDNNIIYTYFLEFRRQDKQE